MHVDGLLNINAYSLAVEYVEELLNMCRSGYSPFKVDLSSLLYLHTQKLSPSLKDTSRTLSLTEHKNAVDVPRKLYPWALDA